MYYGFGINDRVYPATSKEWRTWSDMLRRCYDEAQSDNPRFMMYSDCYVADCWKLCSNFGNWAGDQKGFYEKDSRLDKDILIPNNKIYSPEACCFVPNEINMSLTLREKARGSLPLGIVGTKNKKKGVVYLVRVRRGDLPRISGNFYDLDEAKEFYIKTKLNHLSYLADKYESVLDSKVFLRLKNYQL